MKMNAPNSPPAYRLPVLTEVVSLNDETAHAYGSDSLQPAGVFSDAPPMHPADVPVLLDVADMSSEPFQWQEALREPDPAPESEPASIDFVRAAMSAVLPMPVNSAPGIGPSFVPSDAVSQALADSAHEAAAVAATALEESRSLPGSDLPQPPQWLRRRPVEVPVDLPLPAVAPPSPLPPDFSGSWWSRDDGHVPPDVKPRIVPAPARPVTPTAQAQASAVSEVAVARKVMRELDGHIDLMFDHRMREVIAPALARAADALMADLRERLAVTVREMVVRAVALELSRQQRDGDVD